MANTITATYQTRRGSECSVRMTIDEALSRLVFLRDKEEETKRVAPTDSGDVRFNYEAERAAISDALDAFSARI